MKIRTLISSFHHRGGDPPKTPLWDPKPRIGVDSVSGDPATLSMGAGSPSGDPQNSKPRTLQVRDQGTLFYSRTVLSVDSAETETKRSDLSAITVWRLGSDFRHDLCYAFRDRMAFSKLIDQIGAIAKRWDADVILMETKGAGNQYIQAVVNQGLAPCPVIG